MRTETIIWVHFYAWAKLSTEARQTLVEIHPDCHSQGADSFYARLPTNDERMGRIVETLQGAGLTAWRRLQVMKDTEFQFAHCRGYNQEDLESLSLLEPLGHPIHHDYCARSAQGNLWANNSLFKKKRLLTGGEVDSLLVSGDIRQMLEAEDFRGMSFRPVLPRDPAKPVDNSHLWELTSDQRMPPLSDYCTLFDAQERPVRGSAEKAYLYIEDFYAISELHYASSAVKDSPWDFALTYELFWYSEKRHRRRLVTSKRFFDFCKTNKLKMDWIPVRVDPD